MTVNVFSVPVFFIVFRETLETSIIVSVLFAFLKQTLDGQHRNVAVYKKLVKQVWLGTLVGFILCMAIGGGIIGAFYTVGQDHWAAAEYDYEGAFSLVATLIISWMGAALLRVSKLQEKWVVKLATALESKPITAEGKKGAFKRWCQKYVMFMLPFFTVVREGVEAIVFIAGVSFSAPGTAVPLPVFCGLAAGSFVGYLLYKTGSSSKLQIFLVLSTCLLYLVAAGLFSKAIWAFQQQDWNNVVGGDAAEVGDGPGSYDISTSVWHVNFGGPEFNGGGGWGIFNGILGWENSATYGSVISYNLYWVTIIIMFLLMRYKETRGHYPFMKSKTNSVQLTVHSETSNGVFRSNNEAAESEKKSTSVVESFPAREIRE